MRKRGIKPVFSVFIALSLFIGGSFNSFTVFSDTADHAFLRFAERASKLIQRNWSEDYFSSIAIKPDKTVMLLDNEEIEAILEEELLEDITEVEDSDTTEAEDKEETL